MKIVEVFKNYNNSEKCLKLLEKARWKNGITCPCCPSCKASHKSEKKQVNRHQCQACSKSFTVLTGTIFHSAKKLPEWFQILALMLNAKKSLSSYQTARDLEITQCSAWKIQNKIRKAMQTGESKLLKGIIEMDETCIGGKPRKNIGWNARGRGTDKTPAVGMIERGGKIRTQVIKKDERLNFTALESIVKKNVDKIKSILITDEYKGYSPMAGRGGIAHAGG